MTSVTSAPSRPSIFFMRSANSSTTGMYRGGVPGRADSAVNRHASTGTTRGVSRVPHSMLAARSEAVARVTDAAWAGCSKCRLKTRTESDVSAAVHR